MDIIIYKDDIKRLMNIIERLRSENLKQYEEIISLNKKIENYEKNNTSEQDEETN